MKTTRFRVEMKEDQMPLIDFVSARLDLSRRKAKALIDERNVFVNQKRVWMARHRLRKGDAVEILQPAARPEALPLNILFQDSDYVIADKPAGILANGPDSAETRLQASLPCPTLRAVHRLDRDTSGCLLLAKNEKAYRDMIPQFQDRRVEKLYQAVALGRLHPPDLVITAPLDGLPAVSHVRTLAANEEASHLEIRIATGRTHQIRKHLVSIRHPLAGDRFYGQRRPLPGRLMHVPRQMLHASSLAFRHPATGRPVRAYAPLPHDFLTCLRVFRLS